MGRYATGVRVMRLDDDSRVVTFTRTEHDESEEIQALEDDVDEEELALAKAEEESEVVAEDTDAGEDSDGE